MHTPVKNIVLSERFIIDNIDRWKPYEDGIFYWYYPENTHNPSGLVLNSNIQWTFKLLNKLDFIWNKKISYQGGTFSPHYKGALKNLYIKIFDQISKDELDEVLKHVYDAE